MMMTKSLPPATCDGESSPDDLINNILLRLPAKQLLRYKAVSKSWKTLISSPEFVKSHHRHTVTRSVSDETLIVCNLKFFSVSLINANSGEVVADLNSRLNLKTKYPCLPRLVGSACGIVCVYCLSQKKNNLPINDIYLWNPATKQYKRIPPPTIDVNNMYGIIGFGFDHLSNDFKFVRIVSSPFSAEIYSTNRNCWKKVEHNNLVGLNDGGLGTFVFVCVKGYLCCTRNSHMTAFDLNKETLNCAIELPVTSDYSRVTEFNDSIVVVSWVWDDNVNYNTIKLWKLDDETCISVGGVEAAWSLMLSIDHWSDNCVQIYMNHGDFLPPLGDDTWCFCKSDKNIGERMRRCLLNFKYTESQIC